MRERESGVSDDEFSGDGYECRFAAALITQQLWVMNIVPVNEPDTLPIIFDRGLIGMYHNWCEPHSTYPRSYDLMHADHLFSTLKYVALLCNCDHILHPSPQTWFFVPTCHMWVVDYFLSDAISHVLTI